MFCFRPQPESHEVPRPCDVIEPYKPETPIEILYGPEPYINPKTRLRQPYLKLCDFARTAKALSESGDEGWQEHVASNHGRKPAALQHGETCLGWVKDALKFGAPSVGPGPGVTD